MISPEMLRRYELFAQVDEVLLKELAMVSDEIVLADGVWLFHEGDQADALYIIVRGTVELKIALPGETYADLDTLVEGDLAGWSAACEPHFYKLGAFTPTGVRLIRIDGSAFQNLLRKNPSTGFRLMCNLNQIIGKRLTNLRARFVSLAV